MVENQPIDSSIMFSFTRAVPKSQLRFTVRNSLRTYVSIGDKVPATPVFEGSPGNDINLAEETASGKTILIGVPGAFSQHVQLHMFLDILKYSCLQ